MSETDTNCPICYNQYGNQPDGKFICKDGIKNSDFSENCNCCHYICVDCCETLSHINTVILCPLCREDWTDWIKSHYDNDDDDNEEQDDDEEDDETE